MRPARFLNAFLAVCLLSTFALPGSALDKHVNQVSPSPQSLSSLASAHLEEPLVATGSTTRAEDQSLAAAVAAYTSRSAADDSSALEKFIALHPHSAWNAALHTNLGLSYYHYGYLSKAIFAWEAAWQEGKLASDPRAKALIDRAVGELLRMHARLGHADRLDALLRETKDRHLTGPATEASTGASEGLWVMRNKPGDAYLCGPNGLRNLLISLQSLTPENAKLIEEYHSGQHGVSLAQLSELADQVKLRHRIVYRSAGQPVPIPSIIHWKVNHFAALIGHENGRYHLADPTFGDDLWITESALEEESSGYYLVPEKSETFAWRGARSDEESRVYGMGVTSTNDPNSTLLTGDIDCVGCLAGGGSTSSEVDDATNPAPDINQHMAGYNMHEMVVSLHITDTPVGYAPPKGGGVYTTLVYNQREANQPAIFTYFNISPKWTLNWLAYIQDDPNSPGGSVSRYAAGGGTVTYTGYSGALGTFTPETRDASVLARVVTGSAVSYQRQLANGGREVYSQSDGSTSYPRKLFLTQLIDPAGNATSLHYNSQLRLTSITDATGRNTTFSYGLPSSPLLVTAITDPFGRSAKIQYDSMGRLIQITDTLGIKSQFTYDASSLVNAMTTPYGTTTFVYGNNGNQRYLQATDPAGYTERLEFLQYAPGIPYSDPQNTIPVGLPAPFNAYLYGRNTFYWDKHAYAIAAGVYTKARIRHWTHEASNNSVTNHTVESIKYPLENRVWMYYPGESSTGFSGSYDKPSVFGRVLDDGSTQLYQKTYNAQGFVTDSIDPVGRETQTTYAANGIDPITIKQKTSANTYSTIAQFTYNGQHLPLTATDAAGQTTSYQYNAAGQVTQATDALGETNTYAYDGLGYLTTITNANGKVQASFTYDALGRVATATDSEGYTVNYLYDAFDRVVREGFPDGTTRKYHYTNLDLTSTADRNGKVTTYSYDPVRNLVQTVDPLGNTTKYGYFENQSLKNLTEPNGNTTSWTIDLENRVTGKQYADGSQTTNTYEATTSRLAAFTDAMNQVKHYSYAKDDMLAAKTYTNTVNLTPNVSFTFDPYFPRVASMVDGTGTTSYTYQSAGALGALQLAQETSSFQNETIGYAYDALGRVTQHTVDSSTETFGYDPLGRLTLHKDDLGTFDLSYLGESGQLTARLLRGYPIGPQISYESNTNDRRLKGIANTPTTASFSYRTTPENLISRIDESIMPQGPPMQSWNYTYDDSYRLTDATSTNGQQYSYTLDGDGNITHEAGPGYQGTGIYNELDQVTSAGPLSFKYDLNGNVLSDGFRSFTWDAENRLIGVSFDAMPSRGSTFRYDGLDRRVAISSGLGVSASQTLYVWCGSTLCASRNASGMTLRRYYPEGETTPGAQELLFYSEDQLGSVRGVVGTRNGANVVASFDYDPYGYFNGFYDNAQSLTDFRFASFFYDAQDGLYLTNYRAYEPRKARWLSRDPLGEAASDNPYQYADFSPMNRTDPLGLSTFGDVGGAIGGWGGRILGGAGGEAIDPLGGGIPGEILGGQLGNWLGRAFGEWLNTLLTVQSGGSCLLNEQASDESGVPAEVGPGPYAGEPIPAGPSPTPTKEQQGKINEAGKANGCHTCGTTNPGTKSGNWVGDHQPPTALNPNGKPQSYYPQCKSCSNTQGGRVRGLTR